MDKIFPDRALENKIREVIRPLTGSAEDFDPLMDLVSDARFVLLGDASHGTHEFYHARARFTQRLIREKGFTAVALEADWPDAYRVNCWVRDSASEEDADAALRDFERFPRWMWRNAEILSFVEWLHTHNSRCLEGGRVGVYGLDLYSLHSSMSAVLSYLDKVDPDAAGRARARYSCFDTFGEDEQTYGYLTSLGLSPSCEDEVVRQLEELRRRSVEYLHRDGRTAADSFFYAEQNARLVKNAEHYYRSMFQGRVSSWNLRDRHMAETLEALVAYMARNNPSPRVVVWAHNSHLGNARATDMGQRGELNIGQLLREAHPDETISIGTSTYEGTVTAASDWGGPAELKRVRPALPESYEALFHRVEERQFVLPLRGDRAVPELREPRLERAIGVIYRPETERISHYFQASLPGQFDAILHFDTTRAVEPLDRASSRESGEIPETFPSGV